MQIVATRTRIGIDPPTYAYRVYVPMTELSPERQRLISYRSNFGIGPRDAYFARIEDVIAPMAHLETPAGTVRYAKAKAIEEVASRLSAIILRPLFPEMIADVLPFRFIVPAAPPNAVVQVTVHDLTARYETTRTMLGALTPRMLGVQTDGTAT